MNEIIIVANGQERVVVPPKSWNDLSDRDFLLFYSTLFHNLGDEMTEASFTMAKLIDMTRCVLEMTLPEMKSWELGCITKHGEEIGRAVYLEELKAVVNATMSGLFDIKTDEDGKTTYSCRLNATHNRYERIEWDYDALKRTNRRGSRKKEHLYGPADGLANISIYELGYLFSLFDTYVSTGDEAHITRLIAAMYRPPKPPTAYNLESGYEGDIRQPLRKYENRVDFRENICKLLPIIPKRAILFWFASCRQSIIDQYPKVFKRADEGSTGANYGWGGVLLKVAEMGPMGHLDNVADQHYSNVLTYLSLKDDEAAELERQMKKK